MATNWKSVWSLRNSRVTSGKPGAFTLLEALVSLAIFGMILALVAGMMNSSSSLWLRHRNQAAAFEAANAAFETIARSLSQAVLNTYWEVSGSTYGRMSELHFAMGNATSLLESSSADEYPGKAVFFQAPLGRPASPTLKRLPMLLNSVGYFVRFDDGPELPSFLPLVKSRDRFRLYQWLEPTENLGVYAFPPDTPAINRRAWFQGDLVGGSMVNTAVLAENVAGLVLMAEYPDADNDIISRFAYDSRDTTDPDSLHQLPPRVRIVMAVIDENSASRLAAQHGSNPPPITPDATWFQDPAEFDGDLDRWEQRLQGITPPVDYRIFTTTVIIQNAKWSLSL